MTVEGLDCLGQVSACMFVCVGVCVCGCLWKKC